MSETREYLIKKGSYFYRHNYAGYTSFKFDAGRYTKERAEQEASVEPWHMEAIHQDDVPNDTAPDKAISVLIEERDRLREENERLRQLLRPFANIGIGTNPDYEPMIRMDREAIVRARAALEGDAS